MTSGQHISLSIDEFLKLTKEEFCGKLKDETRQTQTWEEEFDHLQILLNNLGKKGRIIFEYGIPSLNFVIDVVLLLDGKIFVLEYKCGSSSTSYSSQDIQQAKEYAYRLKYFHSTSNEHLIIPILVEMEAPEVPVVEMGENEIDVSNVIKCNKSNLVETINFICESDTYTGSSDWEETWEKGIYKATPTIIKAACEVWERNNVKDINKSEADEDTRLAAEDYIIELVKKAQERKEKYLVFVTGVPGAGKTLVGLGLSVKCQHFGASMLSGNDPLVRVLSSALRNDLEKQHKAQKLNDDIEEKYIAAKNLTQQKERDLEKNKISVDAIIRSAYSYKKEIISSRLLWEDGSYTIREGADRGSLHVVIFDEAQRAWTKEKMLNPGQNGRKDWQKRDDWPFSEPGLLLWDMNQRDWGVFVCLVGGGQEINTGEAGISEWLSALTNNEKFSAWKVFMAQNLNNQVYQRKSGDGLTLDEYCKTLEKTPTVPDETPKLTYDARLHLTASNRSLRNNKVSDFIEKIIDCKQNEAISLYKEIKPSYKIYLTRDLDKAKDYLRKQLLDNQGALSDDVRIGMLMSSKASRLRPYGYEIKKVTTYLSKVSNWFLDPSIYIDSSNFLEVALNEFFVQGLELDFATIMWDADFRYNPEKKSWDYYEFNGKDKWNTVDKVDQDIKRYYMKNAYRVLLTRARVGMVIFIPKGDIHDPTRKSDFYDETYNYLSTLGLDEL